MTEGTPPAAPGRRRAALVLTGASILLAAALLVYGRTLSPDFFFYGDSWLLLEQAVFSKVGHWLHLLPQHVYNDRPAGFLLIKALYHVAGLDPVPYHAALLGLHLVSLLLVWSLTARATGSLVLGWAAAMLFGHHYAATVTVPWVGAVFETLCACFCLLAFRLHLSSRVLVRAAAVLCYVLAVRSKETALPLPLVVAAYEVWVVRGGPSRAALAGALKRTAPLLAVLAAYAVWYVFLAMAEQTRLADTHPLPARDRLAGLQPGPGVLPRADAVLARGPPSVLTLAFGLGLAAALWKRAGVAVVGGLGFLLFLLPVLFLKNRQADFYLYLPSVFFFLGLVSILRAGVARLGAEAGPGPMTRPEALTAVLALILVGLPVWNGMIVERQDRVRVFGRVNRHDMNVLVRRFPGLPPGTAFYISGVAFKGSLFAFRQGVALRVIFQDPRIRSYTGLPAERLRRLFQAAPGPKCFLHYDWRPESGRLPRLTVLAGPPSR